MSPPSLGPAPDLASGRSWWRSVGVWRLQGECPVRALALKWSSADKLVDAIGRSDHSVLYHLQPSSAPPVNESRSGSRRAANAQNRAYAIVHKPDVRGPQSRINRAIARQSSPIVASLEQACHAGGRGFESRRSRKSPANQHMYLT